MIVLGINNFASHDPSASIVTDKNGKIEFVAIAEERLSRVKRPHFSPVRSIKYCMDFFSVKDFSQIDLVVMDYVFDKCLVDTAKYYRKLEYDYIKTKLKLDFSKVIYVESHHLAHAFSAFYPSGFEEAAILVVDGYGSNIETNSLYVGDKNGVTLIDKAYGQGIGAVYELVTDEILGFRRGQEGKTMGLAALGRNVSGENILKLNPVYEGIITDFSEFMDRVPRERLKQSIPRCANKTDVTNDYYSKIAYEIQEETEKCLIHLANYAYRKTGKKKLCVAGGVGLNCVANSKILENTEFEAIFVQPAASDVGLSFGLALYGFSKYKQPKITFSVYTGKSYDRKETKKFLKKSKIPYKESTPKDVADLIAKGNIVGWFIGGSEFGPRALGHRSILADPRRPEMKDIVNNKVKHRESFRPFAPSVLEEKAQAYFEMDCTSPFMLLAPRTIKEKIASIPAVVHVDELARVHTVSSDNEAYYSLIKHFEEITGIPVILNTSFNDDGEPIVETPIDAILCFLRTGMQYLYIDQLLIDKKDMAEIENKIRELELLRKKQLQKFYKESIELLCEDYSTYEMRQYLKSQYPIYEYYNHNYTFMRLKTMIHEVVNLYDIFVTDNYHLEIIEKFMKEEYYIINKHKVVIVEDCLRNIDKIKPNSFVLLYNLSLYIKDGTTFNFYSEPSMLKLQPLYKVNEEKRSKDFVNSWEYNLSKDWDGFYRDYVFSER